MYKFFFFFLTLGLNAQTYNQLENDYNLLLNNNQNELALIKAKEIYNWVKSNESDTCIHLPISLKLIGNAFINNDSAITYYDIALNILKKQKRENHIQSARLHYNKSKRYNILSEQELSLKEVESSIQILTFLNFPDFPFCIWPLTAAAIIYTSQGELLKTEFMFKKAMQLTLKYRGNEGLDFAIACNNMANYYQRIRNYELTDSLLNLSLEIKRKILGEQNPDYISSLDFLGVFYYQIGNYKSSEALLKKALLLREKLMGTANLDYAKSLNHLGILYNYAEEYKLSELYLSESLQIIKNALGEEHINYAKALFDIGFLYSDLGELTKAEIYFKQALNIYSKNPQKSGDYYFACLNALGNSNLNNGNFKHAENYLMLALNHDNKNDPSNTAILLSNLGRLNIEIRDYESAKLFLNSALAIYENNKIPRDLKLTWILNNYGILSDRLGDYKSAETYFKRALQINKTQFGEQSKGYASSLNSLCVLYIRTKHYNEAEYLLLDAIKIYKKSLNEGNIFLANTYNNLGIVYEEKREFKSAENLYKLSLGIKRKVFSENHPSFAKSLSEIGIFYTKINNLILAKQNLKQAFDIKLRNISLNFAWLGTKQKENYWEGESTFYEYINTFASIAFIEHPDVSSLAYNGNILSRSLLMETTRELDALLTKSNDSIIVENFTELRKLRYNYNKMESESSNNYEKLKQIKRKADSLDKILISSVKEFRELNERMSIDWKKIQSGLQNQETAIELVRYFDYSDSIYRYMALIINQGDKSPQLVKLCKENELKQYSPETELKEIYDLVWKPLLPKLTDVKTIYYSPSGLLNNIPFQALYKEESGQREYVMDKFTLHQLTSTRYLALDLKKKEQEQIEPSIALFGGINYNDYPNAKTDTTNHEQSTEAAYLYKNAIVLNRELDSTRTGASYLPGTKKEVETIANVLIANHWQVDVSEGKNATENKIKSYTGINTKAILHIATHGFAFPNKEEKRKDLAFSMMSGNDKYKASDNPMIRSGLLLGGANMTWQGKGDSLLNTTNEDGVLTAYELSQLDLSNTKLAVLSACETGKGEIQGSEGTFGLKRALKLAGVDNMIVSLWKVPDDATMEMMTLFYTELANTKKPVSSFESAQKAMRLKYPNEPKKWAGFVFVR